MHGDLARKDQEQRVAEAALRDDGLTRVVALDLAGAPDVRELLGTEVNQQRMLVQECRGQRHVPSIT